MPHSRRSSQALRVGLVGWACRTGLGQLNADLARLAPFITAWLVPEHPHLGIDPSLLAPGKAQPCAATGDQDRYERFLDGVDAVLFAERQYVLADFDLAREARLRGKRVCVIPMMEFVRDDEPWLEHADLLFAPTRWSLGELQQLARRREAVRRLCGDDRWRSPWAGRVVGGRFGVDLGLFAFRPRTRCRRFLFVNGRGGLLARKGADLVARAAALAPEVPLRALSQVALPALPSHVETVRCDLASRPALYEEGDVLLAPSRWEGLGHQLYEAQACGLPVLTTDAPPMNECGGIGVPVGRTAPLKWRRKLLGHEVRPEDLAAAMRALHGTSIAAASRAARRRMEERHDLRHVLAELRAAIEAAAAGGARRTARARASFPQADAAGPSSDR